MQCTSLGALALAGCATSPEVRPLELPLRGALTQPCERLAIPEESELPPLSEDRAALAAQLAERGFWMRRDHQQEAVITAVCRQRDEVVAVVGRNNQAARGE